MEGSATCAKSQLVHPVSLFVEFAIDRSGEMNKSLPYVTAALLCEKVLREKDESLTLVRIVDRVQYRLEVGPGNPPLPADLKPVIPLQGLVSIKSGPVTGDHIIKIFIQKPGSDRKEVFEQPVTFLGGDHGQNIILNIGFVVESDGLYWLDVVFDEDLLTRIPVMITPMPPGPTGQTSSPTKSPLAVQS